MAVEKECKHTGHYQGVTTTLIPMGNKLIAVHSILCTECGTMFTPFNELPGITLPTTVPLDLTKLKKPFQPS